MSVASRLADRPSQAVDIAKVFGPGVPESFRRGEIASQMTPASPFSPGQPISPYDGYDRFPRTFNYTPQYNVATRPRTHERVNFETLTSLTRSYDVAQICIWHRIDSIRSLRWKLLSADHYFGDVTDAVPLGLAALRKPDRRRSLKTWLAMYLWDVLATDSGCLYRMRNRAGRAVGLKVVSGPTVAPLLDYWGDSPEAPAEAYVQYINGLPWGWLTRDDVIYEPFRPQPDSPYGTAPIEAIILNGNTDIRFQLYFLQRFTAGNLPAAFAAAPESWSPDQIEQFQAYWDAMMFGDQAGKHQIKWMPPGSKFEWSNEKDFSDVFSLFLMRKTCAAYHVVPSDLGFTENVNRSSGESQADVQHRVGDLPLMEHVEGIISAFLQEDLGLPLRFEFDRGEEQVDQAAQAEADQRYMDRAVVSPSEIREMRYGLTDTRPVPRTFFTERAGPIPLNSLYALAGEIDPQTAAPAEGAALPHQVFTDAPGIEPQPPLYSQPLAEQMYGPKAIPPHTETSLTMPVAKEGEPAPGITSETGIYGDPLIRPGEDEEDEPAVVAKRFMTIDEARAAGREVREREMAVFRRFCRARRKAGSWRDFEFGYHSPSEARELNRAAMVGIAKDAGEIAVAGLAVLAADTGRVLMLQRALCDDDPAAGTWEFAGGHLEAGESALAAAWREWSEECGVAPPPGERTGSWTSASGIYQGIVWTVESEAMVPVRSAAQITNPDDPDGDSIEAIAWWDPADLPGNSAVRPELLADIDAVMAALGCAPDCCGADCCQDGGCCGGAGGCTCGTAAEVAKADGLPKGPGPRDWPGWQYDLKAAEHWAPQVTAAILAVLPDSRLRQIARDYLAEHEPSDGTGKRDLNEQAEAWLRGHAPDLSAGLAGLIAGILADAYVIGAFSAAAVTGGGKADTGGWQPGDTDAAESRAGDLGLGDDYASTTGSQSGDRAQDIAGGYITVMGRTLAGGLQSGTDAGSLADSLRQAVDDRGLAAGLVLTVLTAVSSLAAAAWYRLAGVQYGTWVGVTDERICPACLQNVRSDPVPMGQPYPSGDAFPPVHNRCRCAVIPA